MPSNSLDIILQCNSLERNHNELLNGKKRLISNEMMNFIHDLYDKQTTKASTVLKHIESARVNQKLFMQEPNPNFRQLEYCLKKYRAGDKIDMIHIGDVMKQCSEMSDFPDDVDGAFVLSYQCYYNQNQTGFHFCMTTPRLLEILSTRDTIAVDSTYKLNWMDLPLIVLF